MKHRRVTNACLFAPIALLTIACGPSTTQPDQDEPAQPDAATPDAPRAAGTIEEPTALSEWHAPSISVALRPNDDGSVWVTAIPTGIVSFEAEACSLAFGELVVTLDNVEMEGDLPLELSEGASPSSKLGCPYPIYTSLVFAAQRGTHIVSVSDDSGALSVEFQIGDPVIDVLSAQQFAHPGATTQVQVEPTTGLEVRTAHLLADGAEWADCYGTSADEPVTCVSLTSVEVSDDGHIVFQLPAEPSVGEFGLYLTLGQTPPMVFCDFDSCELWQSNQWLDPLPITLGMGR